jgi:hypothetical protein
MRTNEILKTTIPESTMLFSGKWKMMKDENLSHMNGIRVEGIHLFVVEGLLFGSWNMRGELVWRRLPISAPSSFPVRSLFED